MTSIGCMKSYLGVEQIKTNSDHPKKLTVNEVKSKPGALEITFTLPKGNPNISQVTASYVNKQNKNVEFKVSRYSSSILVEGFTGTDEKTVELACIDASGNKSDITYVHAEPLLSPVEQALNTMNVQAAFGGVKIDWRNTDAQSLAIHVLTEDTLQKGVASLEEDPSKTIYNQDSVNTFAYIRQYPSIEQKFGFVISDKWENRTDTLLSSITPYKEEKIDYSLVKAVTFFNPTIFGNNRSYEEFGVNSTTGIQNDGNAHAANFVPQTIFNNIKSGNQLYIYKFVKNLSDPNSANHETVQDVYVTYDLNMDVRLSRVIIYPRTSSSYTYNRSSVKRFRIWGTNDANNERWSKFPETWTLIGEYEGPEPEDRDNLTPEEIEYFNEQNEFSISEDNLNPDANTTESFRYMRLQLMESYNPLIPYYTINEFEMYGDIEQYY